MRQLQRESISSGAGHIANGEGAVGVNGLGEIIAGTTVDVECAYSSHHAFVDVAGDKLPAGAVVPPGAVAIGIGLVGRRRRGKIDSHGLGDQNVAGGETIWYFHFRPADAISLGCA